MELEKYINSCLARKGLEVRYLLQCQHSSGSTQQKLAFKVWDAKEKEIPYVLYFGNGFTSEVVKACQRLSVEVDGPRVMSVGDFCTTVMTKDFEKEKPSLEGFVL